MISQKKSTPLSTTAKMTYFLNHRIKPALYAPLIAAGIVVTVSALAIVASFALVLGSFMLGIYSSWERRRVLIKPPAPTDSTIEYYQYRPQKSRLEKALVPIKFILNIAILPLYVFATGATLLIGLPIYPASLLFSKTGLSGIGLFFINKFDSRLYTQIQNQLDENRIEQRVSSNMKEFNITKCLIEMPNYIRLHTRIFTPKAITGDLNTIPHIIYFKGNGSRYEYEIEAMKRDALALNATVIGFHHSNFGRSGLCTSNGQLRNVTPTSQKELIQEGVAQVQRLLSKGVKANHIILHGHSLGAGIATLVAWHFHQHGVTIKIYSDRSFSSISKAATEMMFPLASSNTTMLQKMVHAFKKTGSVIIKALITLSDWDLNAGKVIHKLPAWEYSVVRAVTKAPDSQTQNDGVISYNASIHRALGVRRSRKIKKQEATTTEQKNRIQAHNKFESMDPSVPNLHMQSSIFFENRNQINATEHFYQFVQLS